MTTPLATSSSNLIQVDPISGELSEFSGATLISDVNSLITIFTNTVTNQINSFMNGPTFNNATINNGTISSATIYSPTISGATISSSVIDNITSSSSTNSINLNDSIAGGSGEMSFNCSYLNLFNNNNEYTSASNFPIFMCQTDGNLLIEINDKAGAVLETSWQNSTITTDYAINGTTINLTCPNTTDTTDTNYCGNTSTSALNINIPLNCKYGTTFATINGDEWMYVTGNNSTVQMIPSVTFSDYRLKQNVIPIKNPLERCLKLKPKNYRMIRDVERGYNNEQEGFIAHEAQDILPSAVFEEKDSKIRMQSIDYSKFTPLLTGAIQELYIIIKNQENDIKELYNIIQHQNKLIEKLYKYNYIK